MMGKFPDDFNGGFFSDHQNVPYYGFLVPQAGINQQAPELNSGSSASSSLSNGFNNDREIFNEIPNQNSPYFVNSAADLFPNGFSSQFMAPILEFSNGGVGLNSEQTNDFSYRISDRFFDEMGLSQRFNGISINGQDKLKGFGFGFNVQSPKNSGFEGFQSSFNGGSYSNYSDLIKQEAYSSSMGSSLAHNLSNNAHSVPAFYTNHSDYTFNQRKEIGGNLISSPKLGATSRNVRARGFQIPNNEDSFIIQGEKHFTLSDLNEISVRGKSIKLDNAVNYGSNWLNLPNPTAGIGSLSELQGNVYWMAQDQNGCRWLQRIFVEGSKDDIQMIFREIAGHVVELMLKPFGNYVIQKFLDVCDEKQRLKIVMNVTEEPGLLVRVCLSTYGTRAVQKLIETLKTRQQISLVVMALKPGFLDLVKDQNGNHVIQRCLQFLSNEDNKFIFDAAARFCVEIATHRHGCCVMQRCIMHSTGRSREKLVSEISKHSLLLAQDPFGNYVVQYVVELQTPCAMANLLSQFKRQYVHLSMQKFSSHVVEKCLNCIEESREQIVRELISVPRFDQLVQDPFANYVIQCALAVTKGPLHKMLVDAVQPHTILRTNPFSKRIFSRNLLKK